MSSAYRTGIDQRGSLICVQPPVDQSHQEEPRSTTVTMDGSRKPQRDLPMVGVKNRREQRGTAGANYGSASHLA